MSANNNSENAIWRIDSAACLKGGEVAGAYLDHIGKTDLSQLTGEEWSTFCMKLVGGTLLSAIGDVHGDQIPF